MAIPLSYSFRSIAVRKGSSAMAVGGIALVVVVFATLLSLAAGFQRVVETSGSPRNVIVLRKGADAELQSQVLRDTARVISELPIVAEEDGRKLVVFESVVILRGPSGAEARRTSRFAGAAPGPGGACGRASDAGPLVRPRLERGRAGRGPGAAAPGHRPGPDADGRPQHLARRGPVRSRRQLPGIRTLDGRRVAAELVSPRRRVPVRAVPRRGRGAGGGQAAERADGNRPSPAPCRP